MNFKEVLDYCKAQAIADSLEPTEVSVWNSICRSYSKKFSTPLHLCLDGTISAEDIMLSEFSDQLENVDLDKDLENLLEQVYAIEDPEYESAKKDELKEFMDQAEAEEEKRVAEGRPIHRAMKGETTMQDLPKSGGISLAHLEREELKP